MTLLEITKRKLNIWEDRFLLTSWFHRISSRIVDTIVRREIIQRLFLSHVVYQSIVQKKPHESMYPWFLSQIRTRSIGRRTVLSTYQSSNVKKRGLISFLYKFDIQNGISPGEINYRRYRCSERERERERELTCTRSAGFIEVAYLFRDIACLPAY